MPATLPHCDEMFLKFFDRWYDEDDRQRKGVSCTRPDMMVAYLPGFSAAEISPLSQACQERVLDRINTILRAAKSDWSANLAMSGDIGLDWVESLDSHYNTERIAELIHASDPQDFSNGLVVTVCEFGAVLGHVMRQCEPRLEWVAEWPYWESGLYDPLTGNIIPPFHWAMKKFSDYGVDDGYVPKIGCMVHILNNPHAEA